MRRVVSLMVVLSGVLLGAQAHPDDTFRTRQVFKVEAALPAPEPYGPSFDPRDIKLLHQALDLVVERKVYLLPKLLPKLEVTLISGTRLVTIDLLGKATLSVVPTGFDSGTITLATHF